MADRQRLFSGAAIRIPLVAALLVSLGYYAGAHLGFALTLAPVPVSPLWPPNAILLAGLALTPVRGWPMVFGAVFVAHVAVQFQSGVPAGMVLSWFVSNCTEALIGAALLRRFGAGARTFETLRGIAVFLGSAGFAAPFFSSFLDAAFVALNGWGDASYWTVWQTRFCANVVANVTLVPVIITSVERLERLWHTPLRRSLEAVAGLAALVGVCWMVFVLQTPHPGASAALLYAPLPLLVAAAVRFGPWGAATGLCACALTAITGAVMNHGPFVGSSPIENAQAIQLFLIAAWVPVMALAAVLHERAVANAEARWHKEQLSMAIDAAQLGRWEWDIEAQQLTWCGVTRGMYEVAQEGPVNADTFQNLVHPEDRPLMAAAIVDALAGKNVDIEFRVRFPDGRIKWILSRGRTVRGHDGRPLRLVGVKVDITARKTAELQMQEQRRDLLQLSRVNVAGEMSSALAHEVNQPLAAILMNATVARRVLLNDPPNLDELGKIVEAIVDDNRQAAAVIHKCGALLRTDEPSQVPLCVNQVVRSFLDVARIDIISRGVAVAREFAEHLPPVIGDPVQLQQVFLNLVINACEAMESLPAHERRLRLVTGPDASGVRVTVQDNGPGVSPDARDRIFEPFVTSKTRRPGLGLAICSSIVSGHGGRLTLEDVPGGGTRFIVWLPAVAGPMKNAGPWEMAG